MPRSSARTLIFIRVVFIEVLNVKTRNGGAAP
jgi:hypothetical protein